MSRYQEVRRLDVHARLETFLRLTIPLTDTRITRVTAKITSAIVVKQLKPSVLTTKTLTSVAFFSVIMTADKMIVNIDPLMTTTCKANGGTHVRRVAQRNL